VDTKTIIKTIETKVRKESDKRDEKNIKNIQSGIASKSYSTGDLTDTQDATTGQIMTKQADGSWAPATTSGTGDMLQATYDAAGVNEQLAGLTATQTLSAKTLTSPVLNTGISGTAFLDEDDMVSDSATKLASQQSIKAYVDATATGISNVVEDTTPQLGGTLDVNGKDITDGTTLKYDSANSRFSVGTDTQTISISGATALGINLGSETSGATDIVDFFSHRHSDTAGFGAHVGVGRSRGTHASPTVVQSGDKLSRIFALGYDGTEWEQAASIDMEVDGTPGTNDMPGRIVFNTTPDGSVTPAEAMRIDNAGNVGIGLTSPLDTLHVVGDMELDHTAAGTDEHALEIVTDAAGFGDVKAIDIDYITGVVAAGEDEGVILVNIDESTSTGGEVFGYEILTTDFGATNVYGMKTGVNVNPISHDSGTFANMDSALNKAVDVLAALSSGGAGNISVFVADNDTVTIGDASKFDEMEILVDTAASGSGVAPTFEYSTGVGTWTAFTPTDGTNGFRNTGAILWDQNDLAGWAVGTGSEFLVRITRTRNSLSTTPIIDTVQIATAQLYSWDNQGVITGNTFEATGDTTAGDNAAMGYTATEGLILTGQGSTNDVTIKNDADAEVLSIPTGTTNVDVSGDILLGTGTGDKSSIVLNDSALADESWSGTTVKGTAGATLAVGDLCYLASTGKWLLMDGILDGTDTGFDKMVGICVDASTDTNPTEMLVDGLIASAAFPAFTVGSAVYASDTAGDMVVAQPSTANFAIRIMGYAMSATVLHFRPSQDYIVHV
ncbi:MAG: hypothetical protein ACXABY_22865, partial [Candidatus Thorarchaeota archaeon]